MGYPLRVDLRSGGSRLRAAIEGVTGTSPLLVDRRILRPGGVRQPLVAPTAQPVLNMLVQKSGRTTQYTRGFVDMVNVTVNVSYAPLGGVARFCRQFRVRNIAGGDFSRPGDSGSLVTTFPGNRPVGLLFMVTQGGAAIRKKLPATIEGYAVEVQGTGEIAAQ